MQIGNKITRVLQDHPDGVAVPDGYVPLRKLDQPDPVAGKRWAAKLVWTETEVVRDWEQVDLTQAEIVAQARKVWPSKAEFWAEFTPSEQEAIAACEVPGIKRLVITMSVHSGEMWSDADQVVDGLNALVTVGIISAERRAVIIAKD
jgi:hypothetical protein